MIKVSPLKDKMKRQNSTGSVKSAKKSRNKKIRFKKNSHSMNKSGLSPTSRNRTSPNNQIASLQIQI